MLGVGLRVARSHGASPPVVDPLLAATATVTLALSAVWSPADVDGPGRGMPYVLFCRIAAANAG
jgi:hypothetical protein